MDHDAILADYKALRSKSIQLSGKLVKTLNSDDIGLAARRLGILDGKTIVLNTEDESAVLIDYAIHEIIRDGENAVARMLRENPPPEGSLELRQLRSMRDSHYTMFRVERRIPGFGVVGFDGLQDTPTVVVDVGFSQSAVPGMGIAMRIHSPGEGWWMSTGASLPLIPKALDRILSANEAYQREHGRAPVGDDLTLLIIRESLAAGASKSIRYATAGTVHSNANVPSPRAASTKVGRNDACPCGSGKKYKKCCG